MFQTIILSDIFSSWLDTFPWIVSNLVRCPNYFIRSLDKIFKVFIYLFDFLKLSLPLVPTGTEVAIQTKLASISRRSSYLHFQTHPPNPMLILKV